MCVRGGLLLNKPCVRKYIIILRIITSEESHDVGDDVDDEGEGEDGLTTFELSSSS